MTETPPGANAGAIVPPGPTAGAVVLCGGHSTRMGRPKALLPFGDEVLLLRICRIALTALGSNTEATSDAKPQTCDLQPKAQARAPRVVVVAARNQNLPPLPSSVAVVRDEYESCGPLAGIATGLDTLPDSVDHAFVTSCDVPLLSPALIRHLFELFDSTQPDTAQCEILVPTDGEFDHVLCGIYHRRCSTIARRLLDAGHRRPRQLLETCPSIRIPVETLRVIDPHLDSFRNMNTPADYAALLEKM